MRYKTTHFRDALKPALCGRTDFKNDRYGPRHYAETDPDLAHEISCTKCAKALGKRLIKDAGIHVRFEKITRDHDLHSQAVYIDDVLVAAIYYLPGDEACWSICNFGFRRFDDGKTVEKIVTLEPYARWNSIYESLLDLRADDPKSVPVIHGHCTSKELAAVWIHENRDKLFSLKKVERIYKKYYDKEDAEAAEEVRKQNEARELWDNTQAALHELLDAGITNFQRAGLLDAIERLHMGGRK